MLFQRRNQKQVAERLQGNVDYYNHRPGWRTWRFWVSAACILGGALGVAGYYQYRGPEFIMNPGPISRGHAAIANDCRACHPQTDMIRANRDQAKQIAKAEYFVPIDQACGQCHFKFALHEPNVAPDLTRPAGTGARNETSSCTSCHKEHMTSGKMVTLGDSSCAACHNRSDLMAAAAKLGHNISSREFPDAVPKRSGGLLFFFKPRPADGYTQTFAAFDKGHPEFQIHTQHLKDPDTLQYNHARHEQADIPNTELGGRLDCVYCHKPDAAGTNFQRVTFERNCMACHALAFDPNLPVDNRTRSPGLVIPHGDPEKVRAFLRTLPNQYIEYALRHDGASAPQAQAFMLSAVNKLADSYAVSQNALAQLGPKLEQKVFYNADHVPTGSGALQRRTEGGGGRGQNSTYFPGCAFCHQVSAPVPNVTPTITKAIFFDRWLGDGRFDHAKHQQQTCSECHASIHRSTQTSDINIPTQLSCTKCHNSKPDGVANDCLSCHVYHNDPARKTLPRVDVKPPATLDPKRLTGAPGRPTLREMLASSSVR